jgi:hypothetical protein
MIPLATDIDVPDTPEEQAGLALAGSVEFQKEIRR